MQLLIFFVNYLTVTFRQYCIQNKLYHVCVSMWHELAVFYVWDLMWCVLCAVCCVCCVLCVLCAVCVCVCVWCGNREFYCMKAN